jgi:hypothetical protein
MSTPHSTEERLLAALAYLAEDAMALTDTPRQLERLEKRLARQRPRRTCVVTAAAAVSVAAAAAGAFALSGGLTSDPDRDNVLTPADPPAQTVLTGLRGVPDYPVEMVVPPSLYEVDEDAGTRAFAVKDAPLGGGGVGLTGLRSIAGFDAASLPADITNVFATRDDVVVEDLGVMTVDGMQGQFVRLTVRPGASARDLWCPIAEPACFKLVPDKTLDVVVLPTGAAPLWFGWEYTPEARAAVEAAAADLAATIDISGGP